MAPIDYNAILEQAFGEYAELVETREQVDLKIAQKEQFMRATINMLPDPKRQEWEEKLERASTAIQAVGLSDAIRKVLQSNQKKHFTATEMRNALVKLRFDFDQYTTNPLASIHSAMKRLKPEEAEVTEIDHVMAWRWKESAPIRMRKRKRRHVATFRGLSTFGSTQPNSVFGNQFISPAAESYYTTMGVDLQETPRIIRPDEVARDKRKK